jgi:filamentous hemagglutinin family protein
MLTVNQSTERAIIDWNTFNLGSAAQVLFEQPNQQAVTLDRVLGGSPSEIFGKITAPGQVFLVNPSGIYFGKSASVDVSGLVATTNDIDNADFMSGNITFKRNGATGSVVNDGTLQASLGGYIALLAPEVRNGGIVIARMGTVAMAAGESITLDFDGQHLAGITAQPSAINALVENSSAVIAPGGLIILSAKAVDSLQGGVVQNSGTLEATGMSSKGGRIVLEASTSVENTGTISANAGTDGSPAGDITITAPTVTNSGSITATGATTTTAESAASAAAVAGGRVVVSATTFTQTSSGLIDVSGSIGGNVTLEAVQDIDLSGTISAAGIETSASTSTSAPTAQSQGGSITLTSLNNVTLQNALIDVSGDYAAGRIEVSGGGSPAPSDPPADPPVLALLGTTELNASSRRGKGGTVTLTAAEVNLLDSTAVDATGATGGGEVYVGGGFHGQDPSIADAQQTTVASGVSINASATQSGDGGQVVLWSSEQTSFAGSIEARGGAVSGSGGTLEVSGAKLDFTGSVNAGAPHGTGGSLLLDPDDITILSGGSTTTSNPASFSDQSDSTLDPSAITNITNTGTSVTLEANDSITVSSTIQTNAPTGTTGGALIFRAGGSITVNASVISDNGDISFTVNDSGATLAQRTTPTATFVNNSLISAGTGSVSITMGTLSTAGNITTGHITAANLTINDNATPAQQASQTTIDLNETDLTSLTDALNINASVANPNLTNSVGTVNVHGPATINVGTGNITITNPNTDFTTLGITSAGAVDLVNANAIQFATTNVASLTETTQGPIAQTSGSTITVSGAVNLTADYGGFGFADPYINLSNGTNHFGSITLDVPSNGGSNTGGYAIIADTGSTNVTSTTTSSLTVTANDSITTGTISAGSSVTLTAQGGPITIGTIGAGGNGVTLTADGAVSLGQITAPNLTVSTNGAGAITDTGALNVGSQTTLIAGAANDITLGNTGNNFNSVQIVSGNDVTLYASGAINLGSTCGGCGGLYNTINGNLSVTAGGDISQSNSGADGYSRISVGGATTFTANAINRQINLYLGSGNGGGEMNTFSGDVTLVATTGENTGFSNVYLRNASATAASPTGLTTVGTLSNVILTLDNATAVLLPGMTVTGSLAVYAPSVANTATTPANTISQSGAITVGGEATFEAASTGDILLTKAGNDFNQFMAVGNNVTVVNNAPIMLMWGTQANGNMTVTTNGNISDQTSNGATWQVVGTLTLDPGLPGHGSHSGGEQRHGRPRGKRDVRHREYFRCADGCVRRCQRMVLLDCQPARGDRYHDGQRHDDVRELR